MTTCPKCGFQGPDPEQCAKCGVIFDRMRTILEVEPLGAQLQAAVAQRRREQQAGEPGPAVAPSDARTVEVPRLAHPPDALAEAFPHLRRGPQAPPAKGPREPTMPPAGHTPLVLVQRPEERRRPFLLGALAFVLLLLLADQWLDRTREEARAVAAAAAPQQVAVDPAYLNLALEGMLGEARRELRRVDDPARVAAIHERLVAQSERLNALLPQASMVEARRASYAEVVTQLERFLDQVTEALRLARMPGARPEPVDVGALLAAEEAFARARSGP